MLIRSVGARSPVLKLRYIEKGLITIDPPFVFYLTNKKVVRQLRLILARPFFINKRKEFFGKPEVTATGVEILWALFLQ